MNYTIIHSVNQFNSLYEMKLKKPSCLPICMEELTSGWTIETFLQIISKLTIQSQTSIPLFYQKHEELSVFSNKSSVSQEVFKLFDTRGHTRIDGMELVCSLAMCSSGPLKKKIEACVFAFTMSEKSLFTKDQFFYFLDCYFRALGKIILLETDTFYPRNPNIRLAHKEIELITEEIFKNNKVISVQEFLNYLNRENGPLKKLFTVYPDEFQKAQENYRDLASNRLKIIPFIKNILYGLI